jgi:hypothetical protein
MYFCCSAFVFEDRFLECMLEVMLHDILEKPALQYSAANSCITLQYLSSVGFYVHDLLKFGRGSLWSQLALDVFADSECPLL